MAARRDVGRRPAVWRLAACAAAFCLAVVLLASVSHRLRERRIEALRAEQARIETELQAVKEIARDAGPVVVLENAEGTRVIMDLDAAIRPAAYRSFD